MKRSDLLKRARRPKISKSAYNLIDVLSSRDTDEVMFRLQEIDLNNIRFAKSVYEGYQRLKSRTGGSLNYYCFVLSSKANYRSPSFYKNWYNIYRHFCIWCNMTPEEISGIDYKILKYISESGIKIFNEYRTKDAVLYLKDPTTPHSLKWKYIRDLKAEIKFESELMKSIYEEQKK